MFKFNSLKQRKQLLIASMLSAIVLITPDLVFAAAQLAFFKTVLCRFVEILSGDVAKGIATVGIIFLGIAAFFGKLNWGLVVTIALGVMFIFGAGTIITYIHGAAASGVGLQNCP